MRWLACAAVAVGVVCTACSPALDWREVRSADGGAAAWFPCKPARGEREVQLGAQTVSMSLQTCRASGHGVSLAQADAGSAGAAGSAVAAWQASTVARLQGAPVAAAAGALRLQGADNAAPRQRLRGRLPDGAEVEAELATFSRGARVYQAMLLAPRLDTTAADTFFDSLRLAPP